MRITEIEPVVIHVNHRGDWVFLRIHTDEGITGLGEASHSLNDSLLVAAVNVMKEKILGRSPFEIQALWRQFAGMHGGRVTATALVAQYGSAFAYMLTSTVMLRIDLLMDSLLQRERQWMRDLLL